jgi:CLIP-associating protein 1/2
MWQVLEASNAIRDALTSRIEPVYGLTTLHANLRTFLAEPAPDFSNGNIKSATYAFGLIALGKFVLRLPSEILEEELPRLKNTLISVRTLVNGRQFLTYGVVCQALNDMTSLVVRESAAASIIASQLVLRDETHLFALLDGLADEKKNLLTYLFDKHGVRGLWHATRR